MERLLLEYIANALWQIPLLAAAAWLLIRAVKPAPLTQHYLWLAVLALAVLLPARGIEKPADPIALPQHIAVNTPPRAAAPLRASLPPQAVPPPKAPWPQLPARVQSVRVTASAAHVITGIYIAVLLFGVARIAFAWRATRNLVQRSRLIALSPPNVEALEACGRRMSVALPELRESSEVSSPVVVGTSSPVMLVPLGFARHADDEVKAALCHELAHLQRRDYLVNLICQVASLPVAWHPVTTGVQRRIRHTREMVCDAIAARQMCSEIGYAKCLMALAQTVLRGQLPTEPGQALGLFSTNTLEERVMRLMEKKSVISLRAKVARAAGGATAMAAAILVAAFFHVTPITAATIAQEAPTAPAQQQAQPMPAPPALPPAPAALPAAAPTEPALAPPAPAPSAEPAEAEAPQPDGEPIVVNINDDEYRKLSPEERRKLKKELERAKAEIARVHVQIQSGEFQKQINEAAKQAADAALHSQEFKKQMAELQARLRSGEFQKQINEAAKQAADASLHSEEFKKQMAELQERLQSGEFQKQIAEAAEQAAKAAVQSEEFQKQMKELHERFDSGEFKREIEKAVQELKRTQEQMEKTKVK